MRLGRVTVTTVALVVTVAAGAGCGSRSAVEQPPPSDSSPCGAPGGPSSPPEGAPATTPWRSGASGSGVARGAFGEWRGAPVAIAGTWNDSFEVQTLQCTLRPGYEYGAWTADMDVAVGAIYRDRDETWAEAASGAYDARWTQALNAIKTAWGSRTGTLHIRFAHEFNGEWVPWSVSGSETADFVAAWKRFSALQDQILPQHKLVFCPNDGTSAGLSLDWRKAFPGAAYVDEMAVDSYNQRDFVTTAEEFAGWAERVDDAGVPVGIEQHRRFAESVGLPMAVAEWGTNADLGAGEVFVEQFHAWVAAHAGNGAGQVPYEILFNVGDYGGGIFQLYPETRQPAVAEIYARLF